MMFAVKYHLVTARVCLAGSFNYSGRSWRASLPSFWGYCCVYCSIARPSRCPEAAAVACLRRVPAAPRRRARSRAGAEYGRPFNQAAICKEEEITVMNQRGARV